VFSALKDGSNCFPSLLSHMYLNLFSNQVAVSVGETFLYNPT